VQQPTGLFYLNLDAVRAGLEQSLSARDLAAYHQQAAPLLASLHVLTAATRLRSDGMQSAALFVGIH
jgi:hypothetical protein